MIPKKTNKREHKIKNIFTKTFECVSIVKKMNKNEKGGEEMNIEKLIKVEGISKHFGDTYALDNVDFELEKGEVHALMGENGAGKSTLGKILAGIYQPSTGEMFMEGQKLKVANPRDAKDKGISIVLQEFNLIPDLSVAENLFIANEEYYKSRMFKNNKKMKSRAKELLDLFEMGAALDIHDLVYTLSIAQMQVLEILKAVDANSKVIILDEPTAALSKNEVRQLFEIIRKLKKSGIGFVIVSHRIEEIFEIADKVTVFRDGKQILNGVPIHELTENEMVKSMVGREVADLYGNREFGTSANEKIVLDVQEIVDEKKYLRKISFQLRKGEIVGLTGLVGAGRTEVARCIFGIDPKYGGSVFVNQEKIEPISIRKMIKCGVAYVPEDRKHHGLILDESIKDNIALAQQGEKKNLVLDKKQEKNNVMQMREILKIKMETAESKCSDLSGGNQQKVLLAKWMIMKPKVLIVDEPTRGIDIAAKSEIYTILNNLAKQGVAILIISSELPEVIGMCDRVLIMRDGALVEELDYTELSEQLITKKATLG